MQYIKKILLLVLACAFLAACKKDKSSGRQWLLSKVYEDGLLKVEYTYSADRKPVRLDNYYTHTGQSVLGIFKIYSYTTDGLLEEVTEFTGSNVFYNKYNLQYDQNKRITRLNDLASDNTLQYYYIFHYDSDGRQTGFSRYNAITSQKNGEGKYSYDQQGKISKVVRYLISGIYTQRTDSTTYTFENREFPSWWSYFETLPVIALPLGDRTFYDMICTGYYRYLFDAPPDIADVSFSGKTYNGDGLLIKQQFKSENTNFGSPVTVSRELTYEYVD